MVDRQLAGTPSVMPDAIIILFGDDGAARLSKDNRAIDFVRDAYVHLKAIGVDHGGHALFKAAGLAIGDGIIDRHLPDQFIAAAKILAM
ncbi:hypothetical protein HA050_13805 [Iodobacter sp. HSC-16F04]|uniref:Large catalase C-terminal domain-containing protein n=1 Tax=Iodobacter violaceini TaxID=3044271 RepID=A0ABX0KXH7_9NEIS|nr:hypothetical protein [Iodobacter violacea]NHQ87187.1 hypothetical protein [Iodobacter violacea]